MSTIAVVGLRAVSIANKSRLDPLYTTVCAVFCEVLPRSHTSVRYICTFRAGDPTLVGTLRIFNPYCDGTFVVISLDALDAARLTFLVGGRGQRDDQAVDEGGLRGLRRRAAHRARETLPRPHTSSSHP